MVADVLREVIARLLELDAGPRANWCIVEAMDNLESALDYVENGNGRN